MILKKKECHMKEPKTRPQASEPKILKRSIRTVKGKIALNKSLNNFNKTSRTVKTLQQTADSPQHDNPEQYATAKATKAGGRVTREASGKTAGAAKKAAKKGYEKIREHHQVRQRDKADKAFSDDVKDKQKLRAGSQAQSSSQKNAARSTKVRQTQGGKQTAKNAIHTGSKTKRTAKTAQKGVKNTRRAAKATRKGVKTAAKTAKRTAKAAKRTAFIAKKAAVAAAKTVKLTVKAIILAVKAAVVVIKGLIAIIAAGGWIVVVIIIIIAVIVALVSSPLAIFSNDSDGSTPTISEVVQQINSEYSGEITGIIADAGDVDEVIVEGETASSDYTVGNWIDVLGVFSVKSAVTTSDEEFVPLVYMEDKQISDLKDVFWSMNVISHEIVTETIEPDPAPSASAVPSASPTPEPTPETIRKLVISIDCKTYEQGALVYGFSDEKMEVLEELMKSDYLPMFMDICGMDSYIGLTPEQIANLLGDLPEGELGSVIVQYAVSRLGDPYSMAKRGQGSYVDCSYFARWCYQQAGVSHFTAPTAASQAEYCVNNDLCISYANIQPGDLIFWSFKKNGRFMNISHVGIYAGDGYVIDASSSRGMVVYRPVFGESSIVICGRPHVLEQ
jgi:cell wall-associated NlpC family hydrolase